MTKVAVLGTGKMGRAIARRVRDMGQAGRSSVIGSIPAVNGGTLITLAGAALVEDLEAVTRLRMGCLRGLYRLGARRSIRRLNFR